jgi:hypothetical protein
VAGGGDGAFVVAAPLCPHLRTSMLYRYQTPVSEITFLLFLESINLQEREREKRFRVYRAPKVSRGQPITPQPRRPTTNPARFRTQSATKTKEWRGMVRKRRGNGEVMTMRCSPDEARSSKMTRATRLAHARRTVGNASRGGVTANCVRSLPEYHRSALLNACSRESHLSEVLSEPAYLFRGEYDTRQGQPGS